MGIRLYVNATDAILEIITNAPAGGAQMIRDIWAPSNAASAESAARGECVQIESQDEGPTYVVYCAAKDAIDELGTWAIELSGLLNNGFGYYQGKMAENENGGKATDPAQVLNVLHQQRRYAEGYRNRGFQAEAILYESLISRTQIQAMHGNLTVHWG
jgi:hypothetical protein